MDHSTLEWTSIRARYNQANWMVRNDPKLHGFWAGIVRDRLGLAASEYPPAKNA